MSDVYGRDTSLLTGENVAKTAIIAFPHILIDLPLFVYPSIGIRNVYAATN